MRNISLAALLFFQFVFAYAQYTPSTVPNTRLVNNSYVSNPDGIISESSVEQINSTLSNLESQTTAQVAVVVLKSIGDADVFVFAQELFTLWGIGAGNDNGLLILFVEDQRTVRFHTGLQLEGVLPDVTCKDIQRAQMVPSFKEGDYDTGLINGVNEVSKILTDPNYSVEIISTETADASDYSGWVFSMAVFWLPLFLVVWITKDGKFADSKQPDPTPYPQMRLKRSTWLILFAGVPVLITIYYWIIPTDMPPGNAFWTLYLYLMITVFYRMFRERRMIKGLLKERKFFEATEYYRKSQWYYLFIMFVYPLPFILYFPYHLIRKKTFRNHSRTCNLCDAKMKKLSEKDEDEFLTEHQQLEEQIKSVDYDVWKCVECGAAESWRFLNRFSSYKECPRCKAMAYYTASNSTIVSATYSRSGKGETTKKCKACGKEHRETYTIAQLERSSSSSSGGSSWSSSSSSSGGSWGGGRSGGGGASSSW